MSKKQLRNRLESLFSNLAEDGAAPERSQPENNPPADAAAPGSAPSAGEPGAATPAPLERDDPAAPPESISAAGPAGKSARAKNGPAKNGSDKNGPGKSNGNGTGKSSRFAADRPGTGSLRHPTAVAPGHLPARQGFALAQGTFQAAAQPWTETGRRGLERNELALANATVEGPAAMAVPISTRNTGDLLIEIVDDSLDREWSEDDRSLVMEIASQLALALDNAQLYQSVQQELAERIRAEQAILRRNKDLATLNRIGQQLTRLAERDEIYNLLSTMIGEVLDNANLFICSVSPDQATLSFPIHIEGGKPVRVPDRPFRQGIPEYVITNRGQLLVEKNAVETLTGLSIQLPARVPASLLAIPMIAGDRAIGAVVVQDLKRENAFDAIHAELLSTAAAQAATALENANLFQQMQDALKAIENRERYQANVARSAAILTEFGTKSMPEVLKALGQAAQSSRVYFAHLAEDERGSYWNATADWMDPSVAYLFDKTRLLHIPTDSYPVWAQQLREKGWLVTQAEDGGPEAEWLNQQHIRSSLLLAVPGAASIPSFIAFDQLGTNRTWLNEEVSVLRVAADAISNTFVREGLLEQLQVTLDETEGLYKASNRLALANDMQEMVSAVLSGTRSPEINRSVLLLFDYDAYGKINQIDVSANWYNGRGTPPPPVGTDYPRSKFERFFQTTSPVFMDDILESAIDKEVQEALLNQNIRSLAILPLLTGKRQIGALLLQSEHRHRFSGRETRTYPPLVDQMAISVENQRLFEQTQVSLAETELLYNVSSRIAQAAGTEDMLTLVVENILPAGADQASLILINSDPNNDLVDMEIVGSYDLNGAYRVVGQTLAIDQLPLIRSFTEEPLVIEDIHQYPLDPASRATLQGLQIAAGCLVPLRTSGRLIGLLAATAPKPTDFESDATRLLRIVGNGFAVALEKQHLLRQAQRRALELQTASEIARDTASTLSLDLLLNRIVNLLRERFNFTYVTIYLLDESGKYAVVRESTGEMGWEMMRSGYKVPVGSSSVIGTVTATGESTIVNNRSSSRTRSDSIRPGILSEMGIPLKLGATVIGALGLQSGEINTFNENEITVLQILADQIAIGIENARAYELSQKALEDIKEIDRVKSQFLANMSHELRTPLNSIIGFSRVILKGIDGPINDTQTQDLSAIYNSGQHLLSLINDILDLSKIEAGKMELSFSDINLADMINSAMSTAVGLVKDKPIRLNTVIPPDLPVVRADVTRVRQVLINFLSNAAKFTDEGTVTVEVSLVSSPEGHPEAMITVTDTGPGIAIEDQAKLFLPFSQVDDSPTRKTGGTGLGLSICRSMIEMHKGRIGLLSSEVGKGSTFFFTLPIQESEEVVEIILPSEEAAPDTPPHVLLAIDDDPKVISLYERYLKPHGYQVVSLTDPRLAIERAKEVRPFAITLDIMMPGKDGWQVLHDLKNDPATREIPIIVCSILENQEKGFSMGAAEYLVKPFLQEDMLNTVNRLNRDGNIRNVLIIDDDADDLRLVKKILEENQNYQVATAQSGKQGWEMLQTQRPDAVVLDLFMPEMNGFHILENLRTQPELCNLPVIVLTGADLTPEQHQQLSNFGQSVLTKGFFRENELLVLLEEALMKFDVPGQKQEDHPTSP